MPQDRFEDFMVCPRCGSTSLDFEVSSPEAWCRGCDTRIEPIRPNEERATYCHLCGQLRAHRADDWCSGCTTFVCSSCNVRDPGSDAHEPEDHREERLAWST